MAMGYLISGHLNVPTSMMKNMYYESVMVFNATFNNISVIGITSPSSYNLDQFTHKQIKVRRLLCKFVSDLAQDIHQ
jgi:hypothetical protein